MSVGNFLRKIAGEKTFLCAGYLYRSFFVNLNNVCNTFPAFKEQAKILDVGGGDGIIMNMILARYKNVHVTIIDVSGSVGSFIRDKYRKRVTFVPNMNLSNYVRLNKTQNAFDYVIISDVIHHIPEHGRDSFFNDIEKLFGYNPHMRLIMKDVEPGYFKSYIGCLADRYVSGEKIKLIRKKDVIDKMLNLIPDINYSETDLFAVDKPNYSLVFSR